IALTPMVWRELEGGRRPWRATQGCCNQWVRDRILEAARAHVDANPHRDNKIEFVAIGEDYLAHGYEYYISLLALRKQLGPAVYTALKTKLGREPTPEEFAAKVQPEFRDRGLHMAKKGLEKWHSQ